MDYNYLAQLLFPNVTQTPEDMEAKFPPRQLPEGAKVTRFAPSPTGFVHFGGLFPSTVAERLALANSIGNLQAFVVYVTQILSSLMMVTMLLMTSSRALASGRRICEVLDEKLDIEDIYCFLLGN